ncbi:hypothetical protein Tco_0783600, partial [Tanacetum coccineum]
IQRISLTGFPAQSVGSSNTDVLDSPCLLVLITGTSQSRQHGDLRKTFEYEHKVALVSVHPSLILHSSLSKKDDNLMNKQELKKVRLCPDVGVKMKFVMELIRLNVSLNEKVLIFSQYIRPLKLLNELITHTFAWNVGKEVMMLKGKVVHTYHLMVAGTIKEEKYDVQVEKGRLAEMVFSSSGEELKNKNAFELEKRVERSVVWVQAIFRSKEQNKIIRSNTCYYSCTMQIMHRQTGLFQEGEFWVWIQLRTRDFSAGLVREAEATIDVP